MASLANTRGVIAVDKKGGKFLFLNPVTYETEVSLDGFEKTPHELLVLPESSRAYVPIFGDGIHRRNPNPQHFLYVLDLEKRLYTENEEDATISVIDLPTRKLVGKIRAPRPLAGIAVSANSHTIVAVDDIEPSLFLIDARKERMSGEVRLKDVPKAAQIARYAPDWSLLAVTSLNSNTVSLIDPSFREQIAINVGSQPMDMAFREDELFISCQGDGSVHVVDIPNRRHKYSFAAGVGCESIGFF